jgi:hypothetical protein
MVFQNRKAHDQLTALRSVGMDAFVNRAPVGGFDRAQLDRCGRIDRHMAGWKNFMRRIAEQIEFCGILRIITDESNVLWTATCIEAIEVDHPVRLAVDGYGSRLPDVQNTQFPTLAEEVGPQFISRQERQGFIDRYCRANDCPIHIRIQHFNSIWLKQWFN